MERRQQRRMTDQERATALAKKRAQLDAQLAAINAREKARQRKADTQRKIVVGGTVLAGIEQDPVFRGYVLKLLRNKVTRDQDKAAIADLIK